VDGTLAAIPAARIGHEYDTAPGAALIAPTVRFDAILLPKTAGMAAMVSLDRTGPAPCLVEGETAILLALPATGRYALGDDVHPAVEVRTGPEQWIALPPSHGTRWDTPPWDEQTYTPLPLLHGARLQPHVADALTHMPMVPRPGPQVCNRCGTVTDDPQVVSEAYGNSGAGHTVYACPDHVGSYPKFVSPLELIEAARQYRTHGS
jgi:hypothetical protein